MSTAVQLARTVAVQPFEDAGVPVRVLPIPWRDPQTVSRVELKQYIAALERACEENPNSPDLRTCVGMAYAMNYDVYKSMDALEYAIRLDDTHFFAQLKYSELFYRLRALSRAEAETLKALKLAQDGWELSLAKNQLREIRRLIREGTQKPEWNKPLTTPALVLVALMLILSSLVVIWK